MLLGLSSEPVPGAGTTATADPTCAVAGSEHGDGGVAHGSLLARLAEVIHRGEDLGQVRNDVIGAIGPEGYVDAAAVCANFNMMVRIADGTGTPLDAGTVEPSETFRSDLGLEELTSRRIVRT